MDRFWSKVAIGAPGECWEWQGGRMDGAGRFVMARRNVLAHRAAWRFTNGEIPAGLDVDQSCRNRLCVNPAHLALIPGGRPRRERHGRCKLTESQVAEIRASGESLRRLAASYGVCTSTIADIRNGITWADARHA
jgi:hypothetical protein